MLIGSKLPPDKTDRTYFSSGRGAFAYLIGEVVKPEKVYLPTYTCWSLVSTMAKRFPKIKLEFYPVRRDLTCEYPQSVNENEALVFMHYFGHENYFVINHRSGVLIEDISHSYMSQIKRSGDFVFGSYRKLMKVADGGFIEGFHNPIYEPSRKLDTWLRLQAEDWQDIREAENMLDREFEISDISSQSLAVILGAKEELIRDIRRINEQFLTDNLSVGYAHVLYGLNECPLLHNRIMASQEERDSLREYLMTRDIYTSIHWSTHELVARCDQDIRDTLWLEQHSIAFPVSQSYGLNAMEYICESVEAWRV